MTFENYKILYFLWTLPVLVFLFLWTERKRARILFVFFADRLQQHLPSYTVWGRRLQFVFFLATLLLFLVALMKPFDGVDTIEVQRNGVDLYFLVDVSPSMLAEDVAPSRIERTRYKILDFLQILQGDRVGLVGFSGEAFVLTPLTGDYETFATFVNELDPSLFPVPGTNIKDAVEKAVQSFAKLSQGSAKAIVLFSDGEDSVGLSGDIVEQIQKLGVQIYVVGIGTDTGAPVPNPDGGYKTDENGQTVMAKLDEAALQNLSLATGGGYVRLTSGDEDLRQIYEEGIQKSFTQQKFAEEKKQLPNYQFQIFIALGLVMFFVDLLLSHKKVFVWQKFKSKSGNKMVLIFAILLWPMNSEAKNPFVFDQANEYFDAGDYAQALQELHSLEKADPQDSEVAYNLGNTYYKLQQFAKAQEFYLKALNAEDLQTRRNGLYNLGNTAFRQNDLEEAIHYYEQSLAMDPDFAAAQTNLDFVKKMLEQQKQEQQKQDEQNKQDQDNPEQNEQDQSQDQDQDKSSEDKNDQQNPNQQQDESNQDEQDADQNSQNSDQQNNPQDQDSENQDSQSDTANSEQEKSEQQKQDDKSQNGENNTANQSADAQQSDAEQQAAAKQNQNQSSDAQKIEGWLKALEDDPSQAIEFMIQKKSSSSPKKFDKDW